MVKAQSRTRFCRIFFNQGRSLHFIPSAMGNHQKILITGVMGMVSGRNVEGRVWETVETGDEATAVFEAR